MKVKNHVWYQPYKLVSYATHQENGVLTTFSKAKIDASLIEKKQVLKEQLERVQSSNRVSSEARELHLLANKVNIGDYIILPLDERCLSFLVGEISGDYQYNPEAELPHIRKLNLITPAVKKDGVHFELYKEICLCLGCEFLQRVNISGADILRASRNTS